MILCLVIFVPLFILVQFNCSVFTLLGLLLFHYHDLFSFIVLALFSLVSINCGVLFS